MKNNVLEPSKELRAIWKLENGFSISDLFFNENGEIFVCFYILIIIGSNFSYWRQ